MPTDRYAAVVRKAKAQRRQIRGLQAKLALLNRVVDAMTHEMIALREAARRPTPAKSSLLTLWRYHVGS